MDTHLIIFSLFPGLRTEIVDNVLNSPDLKGIIFRTFGSGNAPRDTSLLGALRSAMETGKVIVNISQCPSGCVHQERYGTGLQLASVGIVSGRDMTIESALAKLMFLFGKGYGAEAVIHYMNVSLVGEATID